ncbi:MAG: IS66 family transposase, partial [Myxococcales bacterium]|nr:IS66 family transposase [Myxococcales bacterium]
MIDSAHHTSREDQAQVVAWFARHEHEPPASVRLKLAEPLSKLMSSEVSQRTFNQHRRQLAKAMGLIPSSERRRPSGRPLSGVKAKGGGKGSQSNAAGDAPCDAEQAQQRIAKSRGQQGLERVEQNREEPQGMKDDERSDEPKAASEAQPPPKKLSAEKLEAIKAQNEEFIERANLGAGVDPALQSSDEALMNADVVCVDEDYALVPAKLPEGVQQSDVVDTIVESRTRYDFAMTVTCLELDVEKKIVVTKDGQRRVVSGDVQEYGPKGFSVTWQALATLAVMVGQFAMPLNRLGTMLSTATKKFTATSLARMARYVAERLAPIYFVLMEQLADSDILAGDDTSCRVLEVSSYQAKARQAPADEPQQPAPWRSYATTAEANKSFEQYERQKSELLARRAEGDRDAKKAAIEPVPLKVLVGRELDFESSRKNGEGPKQSLNTTVITGRADPDDPSSMVVFYRSHLGSLGNLLEMLLTRRKPDKRKLTVQADLSTTNLVTNPELTSRFDIELAGCSAHARRPFAQYEDYDPKPVGFVLALFQMLAIHEDTLDRLGR